MNSCNSEEGRKLLGNLDNQLETVKKMQKTLQEAGDLQHLLDTEAWQSKLSGLEDPLILFHLRDCWYNPFLHEHTYCI